MTSSQNLVLAINCGSSSIKFQLVSTTLISTPLIYGQIDEIGDKYSTFKSNSGPSTTEKQLEIKDHSVGIHYILNHTSSFKPINIVVHRVVHGGDKFLAASLITENTLQILSELNTIAPLHNPPAIAGIDAVTTLLPNAKQFVVFDTSFHFKSLEPRAFTYAIKQPSKSPFQIRRYGFHGISYEYVLNAVAEYKNIEPATINAIIMHLGSGCSMCAIRNGSSIDTTMGFSPLEGLPMMTRSGDIDIAAALAVCKLPANSQEILNTLNKETGLKALCGKSDMRKIQLAAENNDADAKLALELFTYRIAKYVGAFYVALQGKVDYLIFTGGIGQHSPEIRKLVTAQIECFGFSLDDKLNKGNLSSIAEIQKNSTKPILVVKTNEELQMVKCIAKLINQTK